MNTLSTNVIIKVCRKTGIIISDYVMVLSVNKHSAISVLDN